MSSGTIVTPGASRGTRNCTIRPSWRAVTRKRSADWRRLHVRLHPRQHPPVVRRGRGQLHRLGVPAAARSGERPGGGGRAVDQTGKVRGALRRRYPSPRSPTRRRWSGSADRGRRRGPPPRRRSRHRRPALPTRCRHRRPHRRAGRTSRAPPPCARRRASKSCSLSTSTRTCESGDSLLQELSSRALHELLVAGELQVHASPLRSAASVDATQTSRRGPQARFACTFTMRRRCRTVTPRTEPGGVRRRARRRPRRDRGRWTFALGRGRRDRRSAGRDPHALDR